MDPGSLTLGAVIAAIVSKAADKAGEAIGGSASTAVSKLLSLIRAKFAGDGNEDDLRVLERVQDPPSGAKQVERLADVVDRWAEDDPAWADSLRSAVGEIRAAGFQVEGAVQTVLGDDNITIANVLDSTIQIDRN